jgi:cytochrome c5
MMRSVVSGNPGLRRTRTAAVVGLLLVAVMGLAACGSPTAAPSPEPAATESPDAATPPEAPSSADGAALLQERCVTCHSLSQVESAQKSRVEWEQTVARMVSKGARLSADEQTILIEYLAATYGP